MGDPLRLATLLDETARVPADRGVPRRRRTPGPSRSIVEAAARPRGVLGVLGTPARVVPALGHACSEWKPPHAQWFVGGKLNASVNCVDRHVRRRRGATRRRSSGRASPATAARSPTGTCTARSTSSPTCSSGLGVKKGDRVAIYMPMIPEVAIAMLACARIGARALGGLRRLLRRGAVGAHQRRRRQGADHRRRRLPPRPGRARSSATPTRRCADCPTVQHVVVVQRLAAARAATRRSCTCKEGRDHWWHRLMQDAAGLLRARADGRRGPALHPLHQRHDREAQGHRPHHRRLPDAGAGDHQAASST